MSRAKVEKLQKLLPTEAVRIANICEGKSSGANTHFKEHLPIIKCECGTEILLLPDLQAMNRAIKTHVAEHRKKGGDAKRNAITSSKISQLLSQLLLRKIIKQNDTYFLDTDKGSMSINSLF